MHDRITYLATAQRPKVRRPIRYWTANVVQKFPLVHLLEEIDRHESKAILTARHGHDGIIYKSIR
jgi:hypothetical protein